MKPLNSELSRLSKKLESARKNAEERKRKQSQKDADRGGQGTERASVLIKPQVLHFESISEPKKFEETGEAHFTVVPFPKARRAAEIVRPELNISKFFDFIFIPTRSKKAYDSRKKEWTTTLADGTQKPASILIEPTKGRKAPTTTTFRYFLALIQLWEEKGYPDGKVYFSANELFHILGIKNPGAKERALLQEQLYILTGTTISWDFCFINHDGKVQPIVEHMHILSNSAYIKLDKRSKEQQWESINYARFDENIVANIKANKTRPVNFKTILDIKSDVAVALYNHLDIVLSGKTSWQRKSVELFKDLHFESKRYELKKLRKVELKKWIGELNGKELSNGWLQLSLAETKDGSDLKLVAKRKPFGKKRVEYLRSSASHEYRRELVLELGRVLGSPVQNKRLYEAYCGMYEPHLIQQAISEYKADGIDVKTPPAYFSAILHRIAHRNNLEWINKKCGPDCKYRS